MNRADRLMAFINQILFYVMTTIGIIFLSKPYYSRIVDCLVSCIIGISCFTYYLKSTAGYEKSVIKEYEKTFSNGSSKRLTFPSDGFVFLANILIAIIIYATIYICMTIVYRMREITLLTMVISIMTLTGCLIGDIRIIVNIDSNKTYYRKKYKNDLSSTFDVMKKNLRDIIWTFQDSKAKHQAKKDLKKMGVSSREIENDEFF